MLSGLIFPALAAAATPMVTAGSNHTVALKSDGTVFAWGRNYAGELGDGITALTRASPDAVPGLTGVAAVAGGYLHTVALKSDGTVVAWGWNYAGELGDGTNTQRNSPVAVPGLTGVVAVSAGGNSVFGGYTVALKFNGTVVAWGSNSFGKLGDGTTTNRNSPVAVKNLTGVVAVAAGADHTVALKSDGTLLAWGLNDNGQLGDGTTTDRSSPVAVPGLTGVVMVASWNDHTVALKADGTLLAWGLNDNGQLGDGTRTLRNSPVAVPELTGVVAVSAGGDHSVALKADGTLLAWGNNDYGQLGDGTTTERHSPVAVAGLSGVVAVAAGNHHTVAIKSDGTAFAWGSNSFGKLGDGTSTDRWSPTQVAGNLNLGATVTVVEFYNTNLDNYFITADAGEAAAIDSGSAGPGWSRTGNSFKSGGSTSVCRFYGSQSPGPNSHFYTVDPGECDSLMQLQASTPDTDKRWNFESLDFVSTPSTDQTCTGGTIPVYRAYNNGFSRGVDSNHRITSSLTAIQEVVARGWSNEGVVMCAPQ